MRPFKWLTQPHSQTPIPVKPVTELPRNCQLPVGLSGISQCTLQVRQIPRRQSNYPLLTATRSKWDPDVRAWERLMHWLNTLDGAEALDNLLPSRATKLKEAPVYLNDVISENIKRGIAY